ncbi:MAG TPA: S8 family serine peptidase [Candidatus Limnocylindria bacterium]|nr:S8 family serine peptidase [Candidatus Limnocylindria bacterium]
MSRATAILLALLLLAAAAVPVGAAEPKGAEPAVDGAPPTTTPGGEMIPGEVIVSFRDGMDPAAGRARGLAVVAELGAPGKGVARLLSTEGRPVEDVIAELKTDPTVAYAEPNYLVQLADEGSVAAVGVNDPQTGGQYSLDRMRVRDAWSLSTGASNAIAVLDTGVQFNHPDLAGRLLGGYDFVNGDTDPSDDNGHGTWVSGIIAANANDGYGIAGISWSDKILPVKIMNGEGTGSTANLLTAIRWSADQGAKVINMSVGGFPYSQAMQDAVNYAWGKGAVLVGAAGNNRMEENFYPASFDNVVSVSATQPEDEFSNWSSWGPKVDVSAPGSSVLTTNCYVCTYGEHNTWGSHTYISGTSFATPNVAGVVALMRARYPSYTPQQIVDRLFATVDDLGYPGYDVKYGRGRVNAYRALGASVSGGATSTGDGLEPNNTLSQGRWLALGSTTRPSIYPAGDVDTFVVDVPRAGRLEVRVTGVVDSRDYPWNKSGLPVDPIIELYNASGGLLTRVDNVWETQTELATLNVTGATTVLVRVSNWYANGNRSAYTIVPTYVDTVAPIASVTYPGAGATDVNRGVNPLATFNEPVSGVSSSTMILRDLSSGATVPASVSYDSSSRIARLIPAGPLVGMRQYRVELTSGIRDGGSNALTPTSQTFTTGNSQFVDTDGNQFITEINWLATAGITNGCGGERFCPGDPVLRDQMASFIARALGLPSSSTNWFSDDNGNQHEPNINRIADAGVTLGCGGGLYCPAAAVSREQMASFLARAMALPTSSTDFFVDDEQSPHEADINRLAAAGVTLGCGGGNYCPSSSITRDQMAAFLYRAFSDD